MHPTPPAAITRNTKRQTKNCLLALFELSYTYLVPFVTDKHGNLRSVEKTFAFRKKWHHFLVNIFNKFINLQTDKKVLYKNLDVSKFNSDSILWFVSTKQYEKKHCVRSCCTSGFIDDDFLIIFFKQMKIKYKDYGKSVVLPNLWKTARKQHLTTTSWHVIRAL